MLPPDHPSFDRRRFVKSAATAIAAQDGKYKLYKTTAHFDGTAHSPETLG